MSSQSNNQNITSKSRKGAASIPRQCNPPWHLHPVGHEHIHCDHAWKKREVTTKSRPQSISENAQRMIPIVAYLMGGIDAASLVYQETHTVRMSITSCYSQRSPSTLSKNKPQSGKRAKHIPNPSHRHGHPFPIIASHKRHDRVWLLSATASNQPKKTSKYTSQRNSSIYLVYSMNDCPLVYQQFHALSVTVLSSDMKW